MNALILIEIAILGIVIGYGYIIISSTIRNIWKLEREYYIRAFVVPALPETMQRLARACYRVRLSALAAGVSVEEFNDQMRLFCWPSVTVKRIDRWPWL